MWKTLVSSILAGIFIGIGGTVFLSVDVKIVGAILFSIGLFAICEFQFALFTGKIGYILDAKPKWHIFIIWIGNFIGTAVVAGLVRATRVGTALAEKAASMCFIKADDSMLSILILAIFCGLLMFTGVHIYRKAKEKGNYISAVFAVVICVTVFILCGFEHCVANMYYITVAGAWTPMMFVYLLIMTVGNSIGGLLVPVCLKYFVNK